MDGNLDTQKTMDVDLYATLTRATSIFRPKISYYYLSSALNWQETVIC